MAYQKLQASRAASVTPSNTVNIPNISAENGRGNNGCVLYVGVGGDLKVLTAGGDEIVFTGINSGSFLPVQVLRVYATGTTATGIISLW
jgi:hypothetical protein|tara:strand:- start:209 stop:475 length:267 start_codon:yes stop_codon:yes gene_type:complete